MARQSQPASPVKFVFSVLALTIVIAVIFFALTWNILQYDNAVLARGHETIATVIGYDDCGSGGERNYCPILTYRLETGQRVTGTSGYGESKPRFARQSQIPVIYDPQDTGVVFPKTYLTSHSEARLIWFIGAILIVVTVIVLGIRYVFELNAGRSKHATHAD